MEKPNCLVLLLFMAILYPVSMLAQDQIRPGKIYHPGDTVNAPRYGIRSIIPEGWAGVLPRDTEMFLLMSQENPQSSIYAFGFEDTKQALRNRWMNGPGMEVENNIKLVRDSDVFERGEVIAADLVVENSSNAQKGYIEAKCSEYDRCLILLLVVPEQYLETAKSGLKKFMDNAVLEEPSMGDIYENFDWAEFFGEKYLATRQVNPYENSKRNNQLWMCPDGTFKSHIRIKGFATVDKKIRGNSSGTWEATGTGTSGLLRLNFKKLDETVEIPVELRDDKIYVNDIRYYVMENNTCK